MAVGDLLRLVRSGTVITIDKSTDSGMSWSTIYTFVDESSDSLYPKWCAEAVNRVIKDPSGFGLS